MKFLIAMAVFLIFSLPALAQENSTGVGLTLGSPNGVTGRTEFGEGSIDFGAGWGLLDSGKFEIYSDYLWKRPDTFEINGEKFDLFFGGGLVLRTHSGKTGNAVVFGPRLPVGVSYEFSHPDVEVFTAFALNVGIIPSSDVFLDAHVGVRFYLF